MNDRRIEFRDGALGMFMTVDEMNAKLSPHGLCIAPLPAPEPPKQTEAERLVGIAKGLPEEVWKGSGWRDPLLKVSGMVGLFGNDDWQHFLADQFRTILLGAMAAYVASEKWEGVCWQENGAYQWTDGRGRYGIATDLLTAYAACCKAIAARRKGVGNGG